MTDFLQLCERRRSIRRFTEQKLTDDEVVELLKPALMCPSSKGKAPCAFVAVDDSMLLHELSEIRSVGIAFLAAAPLAVVVVADASVSDVWVEDASIAAVTLLYQAEALGLGACWAQVRHRYQDDGTPAAHYVREILGLPDHIEPLAIVGVGHKAAEKRPHDEAQLPWEKVHLNRY